MKCTDNLNPGCGHVLFALQIKMLKNTVNKSVRKACGSEFKLNMQDRRKHDWHILQVNIKYIQIAGPNAKSWCHNQDRNSYCHSAIFNCWLHDFLNVPQVTWTFSKRALISAIPVAAKKGKRLFQSGMTWYTDYKENYSIDIGKSSLIINEPTAGVKHHCTSCQKTLQLKFPCLYIILRWF